MEVKHAFLTTALTVVIVWTQTGVGNAMGARIPDEDLFDAAEVDFMDTLAALTNQDLNDPVPLDILVPPELWTFQGLSTEDSALKVALTPTQRLYLSSVPSLLPHFNSSCSCEHRKCSCCVGMEAKHMRRNHTGCASLAYVRERLAVTLNLSFNNHTIMERDLFSGASPPPFCLPLPQVPFITICLRLSNISLTNDARLQGCASIEAGVVLIPPLIRFRFGCLVVGPGGASWTREPVLSAFNTPEQNAMEQFAAALNSTEKDQFLLLQSILRQQALSQRMLWR